MKNNFSLFERPFEIQKNGVFRFKIFFFIPEIWHCCIMQAAKLLSWHGCHCVSFVMHICGAKFQEHCFNSFRDIAYSVFYHFFVANLMTSSLI